MKDILCITDRIPAYTWINAQRHRKLQTCFCCKNSLLKEHVEVGESPVVLQDVHTKMKMYEYC